MKKILIVFAAGCLGALVNSLTVWVFGYGGITASLGVAIAPSLSPAWLYPRIVWGGLWGLFFILPLFKSRLLLQASVWSLLPTAVQLFIVFPFKAHKGMAGLDLGLFAPLFVVFFNWVWRVVTALTIKYAR